MRETKAEKKNVWIKAGLAVGVVCIIVGVIFLFGFKDKPFYGVSEDSGTIRLGTAKFGADFYTEIYESTTFAANAVKGVYEMLSTCFGALFVLAGAIDVCVFGSKLPGREKVAPVPEETPEAEAAPDAYTPAASGTEE